VAGHLPVTPLSVAASVTVHAVVFAPRSSPSPSFDRGVLRRPSHVVESPCTGRNTCWQRRGGRHLRRMHGTQKFMDAHCDNARRCTTPAYRRISRRPLPACNRRCLLIKSCSGDCEKNPRGVRRSHVCVYIYICIGRRRYLYCDNKNICRCLNNLPIRFPVHSKLSPFDATTKGVRRAWVIFRRQVISGGISHSCCSVRRRLQTAPSV
jgi:hypothetical protein